MLGAVSQLRRTIPGIRIDAEVGRSFDDGVRVLRQLHSAGRLPPTVVIGLGSNGWLTASQLDQAMEALAGVDLVAFINLKEPRDWEDHDNQVLAAAARRYSNVRVIDWHDASVGRAGLFWDDGIHLRAQGASAYARLVAASLY
jgi:lysophospholipase L1-like esterase